MARKFPTCSSVTLLSHPDSAPSPSNWLDGLNPPQREAVLTTEGPVLMLAGAGTGKTAALTARLAHLLRARLAWPSEILCVTFTNKAAREMRERVGALIGPSVEGMPWLGTFHSVAAKMLRRHAELVGLQANFTIIDTDDQLRLLKQLIVAEGLDEKRWPARQLAGLIDRWKNRGLGPRELDASENEAYANGKGTRFYTLYQDRLRALNACDFGDLTLHMLTMLQAAPRRAGDMAGALQIRDGRRISGYQCRPVSVAAAARAKAARTSAWWAMTTSRSTHGAAPKSPISCASRKDFPGAKVIRLEQNYRSTPHILAAAGGVIAENSQRLGKTLWTEANGGDKVRVIGVWDGPEEARRVGEEIERLEREGASLDRVAILVRASFQTREFEDRFIQIGLNYKIVGGFRFYERAEIRDALAYLRVVASPPTTLPSNASTTRRSAALATRRSRRSTATPARTRHKPLAAARNRAVRQRRADPPARATLGCPDA